MTPKVFYTIQKKACKKCYELMISPTIVCEQYKQVAEGNILK